MYQNHDFFPDRFRRPTLKFSCALRAQSLLFPENIDFFTLLWLTLTARSRMTDGPAGDADRKVKCVCPNTAGGIDISGNKNPTIW